MVFQKMWLNLSLNFSISRFNLNSRSNAIEYWSFRYNGEYKINISNKLDFIFYLINFLQIYSLVDKKLYVNYLTQTLFWQPF